MNHPMDYQALLTLMQQRRSIRNFLPQAVPAPILEQLLEAARWAPSAANRQPFRLLVVQSKTLISAMGLAVENAARRLTERLPEDLAADVAGYAKNFSHFSQAPVVIGAIYRPGADLLASRTAIPAVDNTAALRPVIDSVSSVSAAIMNLLLAVHALGLGACWMTGPLIAAEALRDPLKIPRGWELAALIPIGYYPQAPPAPPRRPLTQLVRTIEDPILREEA